MHDDAGDGPPPRPLRRTFRRTLCLAPRRGSAAVLAASVVAFSVAFTGALTASLDAGTAHAQEAPKPEPARPEAPKPEPAPTEFLAADLVRRPDGMVVHYYRVNWVDPKVLQAELELWKSAKAQISATGSQYAAAPVQTPPESGKPPKTPAVQGIQNVLRIVETEENFPVLRRILEITDVPQPQVRVEAKVVEVTWDDQTKLGFTSKITRPVGDTFFQSAEVKFPNTLDAVNGGTFSFKRAEKYLTFDYVLQAAAQGARAEITSQPSVLASQGETAVVRAGDEEPFVQQSLSGNNVTATTQFRPVGVRLEVQPLLVGRDTVRVRVAAEASRLSDFRVTATSSNQQVVNPVISSRNADTVVNMKNGGTLIIGGLEQVTSRDVTTGIPLLKDIPVLGLLFGSTSTRTTRTEVFFWVKITIENPFEAQLVVPPGELLRNGDARPRGE